MEGLLMDAMDRRIVHSLWLAPRASFRDLATVVGTTDQTVARRYRALVAGAGLRVTGRLLDQPLGRTSWVVRVQCTPDAAIPVAQALAGRSDTLYVRLGSGGTEVMCSVQTDDDGRDRLLLDRLTGSRRVVGISAHLILNVFTPIAWSGLSDAFSRDEIDALTRVAGGERAEERANGGTPLRSGATIDADDEALVALLRADGRASFAWLASELGWNESTVRRRVGQLTDSGILLFDVDFEEAALGISTTAQVWLSVDPSALDATGRAVADHAEAPFVAAVTGPANLLVSVACRDPSHLYDYLTNRLGQLDAIRGMESVPVLRTYKRHASVRDRGVSAPTPVGTTSR